MRSNLDDAAREQIDQGYLQAPDGRVYRRQGTRTRRRALAVLIESGAPVVLHYWAGDQLDWLDADDARQEWDRLRPSVVQVPSGRGEIEWTGGPWQSDDGRQLVFLTGHC